VTNQRQKFKESVTDGVKEEEPQQFKARELNRRILETQSKLPEVERKDLTLI
jgi:hypothetical protein